MPYGVRFVIGLGSNLGDRRRWISAAARALDRLGRVDGTSALYESEALGGPPQGRYLNAAVALRTGLSAEPLLASLLEIERDLGRERRERWGPRTIDLDLLWAEGLVLDRPALQLPHPRLVERSFALKPLLDVVPEAVDPISGERYAALLERLGAGGLARVASPGEWLATPEIP